MAKRIATTCCPTCGRALAKAPKRATEGALTPELRAGMTDAEVFAHYKRTAHVEDVRRFYRFGIVERMPKEIQEAFDALLADVEAGLPRATTYRRLWPLVEQWGTWKLYGAPKESTGRMLGATKITEAADWDKVHACGKPKGGRNERAA